VKAHQAAHRVATQCRVLGVSSSGYYAWQHRPPSARAQADGALTEQIRAIHTRSRGTYGAPRIQAELAAQGTHVGRKRVARLLQAAGLAGVSRRRPVWTTRRDPAARPALYLAIFGAWFLSLAWFHPRLVALLDLAYHDVNRSRGLYYLMERSGKAERMVSEKDISRAMREPPQTTRAKLRGDFIKHAKQKRRDYTVDWVHLKLNDQAQRTVLCKDPFRSVDDRVEQLIAHM